MRSFRFLIFFACFHAKNVFAAELFYEPFNYASGVALTSTGAWSAWNEAGLTTITVSTTTGDAGAGDSLSTSTLPVSVGRRVITQGGAAGEDVYAAFSNPVTSTTYYSFLLKVISLPTASNNLVYLNENSSTPGARFFIRAASGKFEAGLSSTGAAGTYNASPVLLDLNRTQYFVVKLEINAGALNDRALLYVNPDPTLPEPASSYLTVNFSASELNQIAGFGLRQASTMGQQEIDEIRVGDSWLTVTPVTLSEITMD